MGQYWAGRQCEMCKADLDMAYKHVSVRPEDHRFQVIEFGSRYFIKKCLKFREPTAPHCTICLPLSYVNWLGPTVCDNAVGQQLCLFKAMLRMYREV